MRDIIEFPEETDEYSCDTCKKVYTLQSEEGYLFSEEDACSMWTVMRRLCKVCYDKEFPKGHEDEEK